MGLLGWIKGRRNSREDGRVLQWRVAFGEALEREHVGTAAATLRAALDALALPEDESEIEREMLGGLEQLAALQAAATSGALPTVATGHRIVGADICHFTAPVSMPDEPSEPGGRLFMTGARLIFAGGAGVMVAWHAVGQVLLRERDLVLVRKDQSRLYRFRCNSFGDALTGSFIARQLANRGATPR